MANYKVIQDIEAEDKILGPLTLKQFIFSMVAALCMYLIFLGLTRNLWPLVIIAAPIGITCGVLAFPWHRDQPTEVWLSARLRYWFKPRQRIWDQEGIEELVTITAPKREEPIHLKMFSQGEFKSRLQALASTLDSRGWAIKNVDVNMFGQPSYMAAATANSDRLIAIETLPQDVPPVTVNESDDMLADTNPVSQHLTQMMDRTGPAQRKQAIERMQQAATGQPAPPASPPADYWFLHQNSPTNIPNGFGTFDDQVVHPGAIPTDNSMIDDATAMALLQSSQISGPTLHQSFQAAQGRMKTIDPNGPAQQDQAAQKPTDKPTGEKQTSPAILELARNDDFNVATLARQAKRLESELSDNDVISLH